MKQRRGWKEGPKCTPGMAGFSQIWYRESPPKHESEAREAFPKTERKPLPAGEAFPNTALNWFKGAPLRTRGEFEEKLP